MIVGNLLDNYSYTYDSNNNILTVKDASNSLIVSYGYDGLNRLIRENIVGGNTTVFKYDKGGNLQLKKIYAYSTAYGKTFSELLNGTSGKTVNYGYGNSENKDLLTSYNGSGTLAYNGYGNPEKWFKHGTNGSSLAYTLQWGPVSNLTTITDDDTQDIYTYIYNDQGIRIEKIINDVSHKYYLRGEQIIAERYGNNLIKFYYDATGVCGFNYNGTDYYYQKNIQGDILKVFNGNGTLYAEYSYDAWGKCTIKTNVSGVAAINPFRYRGYYLDDETGLYYLNARYYDPEIGRFISPDSLEYLAPNTVNGVNLFVYCLNNPVMSIDPYGHDWWHWLVGGFIVITLLALTCISAGSVLGGMLAIGLAANGVASTTLATSILAFATVGAASVYAASAIVAGLGAVEQWISGGSFQSGLNSFAAYGENAMWATALGGMTGAFGGYLSFKQQTISHSWTTERKRYWISQSNNPNSQWYGNSRAAMGYAPFVDGNPIQLHHTMGRGGADFYYYVEMTRAQHIQYHQTYGYKNFSFYTANINFWSLLF